MWLDIQLFIVSSVLCRVIHSRWLRCRKIERKSSTTGTKCYHTVLMWNIEVRFRLFLMSKWRFVNKEKVKDLSKNLRQKYFRFHTTTNTIWVKTMLIVQTNSSYKMIIMKTFKAVSVNARRDFFIYFQCDSNFRRSPLLLQQNYLIHTGRFPRH